MEPESRGTGRPDHVVICSYVPLLDTAPGQVVGIDDPELVHLLARAEACPTGQADALLWVVDSNELVPVFVLPQADAIADHLLSWVFGRPGDWIGLCLAERGSRFVAALVPNIVGEIERFRAAHPPLAGREGEPCGYEVLCRPLFFTSSPAHAFGQVRHRISDTARVGLLDSTVFDEARPPSSALSSVRYLGPVGVARDERPFGYDVRSLLDHLVAWAIEPTQG